MNIPNNQQNNSNTTDFGYSYSYSNLTKKAGRINGIEFAIICGVILILIIVFGIGFFDQSSRNKDSQKQFDIEKLIIPALSEFYTNSGSTEAKRFFPKSVCSQSINEVDYEMTLRQYLSGQIKEVESHSYLDSKSFPRDRDGLYSNTFSQRRVEYRCPEKLNFAAGGDQSNNNIYQDFASCNFRRGSLNNCYLYTSTSSGDKFEIAYFSQKDSCFIIYSRYRSDSLQKSISC